MTETKMEYSFLRADCKLTRTDALDILSLPDVALPALLDRSFVLRKAHRGMSVGVQLLTNARSGDCTQNCAYCAQAADATSAIEKYRLVDEEKLADDNALVGKKKFARHCIGFSGLRFTDDEINTFAERIRRLKTKSATPICCSIGFLTEFQARSLKDAGVDRINHNLNTSRAHYPSICTTHTWDERVANLRMLKAIGLEICCGGILGMGESRGDVCDLLFSIRELEPEAVPINFLIPLEGTRLENMDTSDLTPEYCLKVLALARLLLPDSDIRCAAGREVYLSGREREMFMAVDSIFASGYLTADGQGIDDTLRMIRVAGFDPVLESA